MEPLRPLSAEIPALRAPRPTPGPGAGAGFEGELGKALGAVEQLQQSADREAEKLALGGGNLHEAALALEKADVALRLATKVRNKLVEAYQEVMRMSV
jgi:flagellar hook-basal body complex protein FliE